MWMGRVCPLLVSVLVLLWGEVFSGVQTKYTGEFLKFGVGVREMSLGGAVVSSASPVVAYYWNPAVLSMTDRVIVQIMHSEEFAGVLNYDNASIVFKGSEGKVMGIGFIRVGVDSIHYLQGFVQYDLEGGGNEYRPDYSELKFFNSSLGALYFSLSSDLGSRTFLGINVKFPFEKLYKGFAWGIGIDAGVLYVVGRYNVGVVVRDVTGTLILWSDGYKELVLPSLSLGVSAVFKPGGMITAVSPSFAIDVLSGFRENKKLFYLLFANARLRAGCEIVIKKVLKLRFGRDDLGDYTVGAGVSINFLSIDYGVGLGGRYSELGNSHRVGLMIDTDSFKEFFFEWIED